MDRNVGINLLPHLLVIRSFFGVLRASFPLIYGVFGGIRITESFSSPDGGQILPIPRPHKVMRVSSTPETALDRVTPWAKIHILGIAAGLSFMGASMSTFTAVLRDKDLTGPIGVSLLFLGMALPNILFAPVAGLIADRFPSRRVIPTAVVAMSANALTLAFMPSWWAPIALFIIASFGAVVGASNSATIAHVTRPEDITRIQGVLQSYVAMGMLFGPAGGGLLVSGFGFFWPFIIHATSLLVVAITFLALGLNRIPEKLQHGERKRALDGVRFIAGNPLIRSIVVLLAVQVLAIGSIGVGEVFLLTDELGASALIYGLVGATLALGMVTGSILVQLIKIPVHRNPLMLVIAISMAAPMIGVLSQIPHWGYAFPVVFIAGLGNAGLNAFAAGTILRLSSEEIRGRVVASFQAIITVGSVTATALGGVLIAAFGVRNVLLGGGILAVIALVYFAPKVLKAGRELELVENQG